MIHLESKQGIKSISRKIHIIMHLNTHEKTVELNRFCSEIDVGRVNKGTNNGPSFFDEK